MLGGMVAQHWQQLDPLLPTTVADPEGDRITVDGGYGIATTQRADLAQLSSTWTDDLQHVLHPRVTTPAAMDALLTAWLRRLPADERGLTKLTWPSRGTDMAAVLHGHGFRATGVLAIRPAGRESAAAAGAGIRPVEPGDSDAITRLWLELVEWDAQFGNLIPRPRAPELIRRAAQELCGASDPLSVVAEQDGTVVAGMAVQPAADAEWAQSMTSTGPAAYLVAGLTTSAARGRGVGAPLARAAAARADAEHPATLLNYNLLNPLSGPFWHRMGYRPLWMSWRRSHAG